MAGHSPRRKGEKMHKYTIYADYMAEDIFGNYVERLDTETGNEKTLRRIFEKFGTGVGLDLEIKNNFTYEHVNVFYDEDEGYSVYFSDNTETIETQDAKQAIQAVIDYLKGEL